jgi:branched-subunit amino acid transport protein AzlD
MVDRDYILKGLSIMAAATYLTRVFPFLLPRRLRANVHLQYVGKELPPAVMLLLVVYCLKGTNFVSAPYGLPELLCVAIVAGTHLWKRQGLLSIGLGTACYVILMHGL